MPRVYEASERFAARLADARPIPVPRYEPWETGVTCGNDSHDESCLCDVRLSAVKSPMHLGDLHEIAWQKANGSKPFVNGEEFVNFLSEVASMHGTWLDYCRTTGYNLRSDVSDTALVSRHAVSFDPKVRARCIEMLDADVPWSEVRRWLSVHGFDREIRAWSRTLSNPLRKQQERLNNADR